MFQKLQSIISNTTDYFHKARFFVFKNIEYFLFVKNLRFSEELGKNKI